MKTATYELKIHHFYILTSVPYSKEIKSLFLSNTSSINYYNTYWEFIESLQWKDPIYFYYVITQLQQIILCS